MVASGEDPIGCREGDGGVSGRSARCFGYFGKSDIVEDTGVPLSLLLVEYGVDDGHLGGPGRLDGGWVPHVLQTTMADAILDRFVVSSTEGEDGLHDISLASAPVLGGGVGCIPFRV